MSISVLNQRSRSNSIALRNWNHKHAPISDLARPGGLDNGLDDVLHHLIAGHDLNFHFWYEAHSILLPTIERSTAFLLAVATNVSDGNTRNAKSFQRCLRLVNLVRPDDCFDEFH